MTHDELRTLLPDYADGALERVYRDRVADHVAGCEDCRSWLETYRLLKDELVCRRQAPSAALARYTDGPETLPDSERQRIQAHLEICGHCRRELSLTRRALASARRPAPLARLPRRLAELATARPVAASATAAGIVLVALAVLAAFVLLTGAEESLPHGAVLGEEVIFADGELLLQEIEVREGGHLLVQAGRSVALGDGFRVAPGGRLTIESGGSQKPPDR